MSNRTDPADLASEDRVTYLIGAIARGDVSLEMQVRSLFLRLAGPRLGAALMPYDKNGLIRDCESMVAGFWPTNEIADAAAALFKVLKDAQATRNRLVHDLWFRPDEGEDVWWRMTTEGMKPKGPNSRELREFEQFVTELDMISRRVGFFTMVAPMIRHEDGYQPPFPLEYCLAVVRAEFRMDGTQLILNDQDLQARGTAHLYGRYLGTDPVDGGNPESSAAL